MTKSFFKKQERRVAGVILGFLLVGFFAPISIAFAAIPGLTPSQPSEGNDVCFDARDSAFGSLATYCYPTMAICGPKLALVPLLGKVNTCVETFSQRTWWEKHVNSAVSAPVQTVKTATTGLIGSALEAIASLIFKLAGFFMESMGQLFDMSISRTIDSRTYKDLASVNIAWATVRDLANMFFIFILLYIAIQTILGLAGGATKRWLANVVIAALLINFSLFITQVVIDAGNALAFGFWDQIKTQQGPTTVNSATAKFLEAFRIQTTLDTTKNNVTPGNTPPTLDAYDMAMIKIGGALVMFIAGYVFLAGAIMMIVRTVTLIIVMIASPLAFMGFALPKGGGFASEWLKKLIGSTFVAPVFIAMLWIDSIIISTSDATRLGAGSTSKWGLALSGTQDNFAVIYNFAVMIILLLASMVVANYVSSGAADTGGRWAKRLIGGGVIVGAAGLGATGRQIGGRVGKMTAESKKLREMAESGNRATRWFANTAIKTGEVAKKGTWDVRNAPMGALGINKALKMGGIDAGAGSKRTFDTHGSVLSSTPIAAGVAGLAVAAKRGAEKVLPEGKALDAVRASSDAVRGSVTYRGAEDEAAILKTAEERFKLNPAAKEQYLRDKLGPQYEEPRHKETRDKIAHDVVVKERKDTIKTKVEEGKKLEKDLASGTITKEVAEATSKTIAKAIGDAMAKLNSRDIADMLPLYATSSAFTGNLSKQDLHVIHQRQFDGKYDTLKDTVTNEPIDVLENVTKGVIAGHNEDAKKYLMSTEGQKRLFNFSVEKYAKASVAMEKSAEAAAKASEESKEFRDKFTVAGSSYSKKA